MAKSIPEPNLLSKLHRWAKANRQDENFITETFAHLLQYLLRIDRPTFGKELIKKLAGIELSSEECKEVKVTSQPTIFTRRKNKRRPDIKISGDNIYVLVEVKVDAGLDEDQLGDYLESFKERSGDEESKLVLLTKKKITDQSKVPPEIKQVRWEEIGEELARRKKATSKTGTEGYLVRQLLDFFISRGLYGMEVKPAGRGPKGHGEGFNVWIVSFKGEKSWNELSDPKMINPNTVWSAPPQGARHDLILAYRNMPKGIIQDIFALDGDGDRYDEEDYFGWMAPYRRVAVLANPIEYASLGVSSLKEVQNLLRRQKVSAYWPDLYKLIVRKNPGIKAKLKNYEPAEA